jgi:hypothetical protein
LRRLKPKLKITSMRRLNLLNRVLNQIPVNSAASFLLKTFRGKARGKRQEEGTGNREQGTGNREQGTAKNLALTAIGRET